MDSLVVKGIVTSASAVESGTSTSGKEWKRKTVVVTESEGQYPKSVAFTLMKPELVDIRFSKNEPVTIHGNVESKEYNGKWFTNVTAWKVEKEHDSPAPQQSAPVQQAPQRSQPVQTQDDSDNLPF